MGPMGALPWQYIYRRKAYTLCHVVGKNKLGVSFSFSFIVFFEFEAIAEQFVFFDIVTFVSGEEFVKFIINQLAFK